MILYRGFNNKYSKALGIRPEQKGIWMTDDYEYAKEYADMFKNGAIAEIELDDDYISLASEYDCFKIFGDDFDELGGDIEWDNEICSTLKENGYDGLVFDDYGVYCYYIFNRDLIKGYKIVETFKNDREDAMESINNILKNAGVKQLNEKVVRVNKDLTDTKLITTPYELNEYLKNHTESRVVYDKVKNWFLVDDSENSIHTELINDALIDGYYEPFEYNGQMITGQEPNNKGGDLLYDLNPQRFVLLRISSDPLNGENYYYDRYQTCYIYDEYCVFDRKGDFVETPLYKLLGEPEDIENLGDIDADEYGERLNESIVYGSRKDLSDIILMNPTRKELRKNNMMFSRCMVDSDGCWYFCDMENMLHSNIESIFREDVFFPYYDGNDCYGIAYYDLENNEFWYNDNGDMTKKECENQYKQSDYLRSTFPNAKVVPNPYGWNGDDDLYESLSENGFEIKDDADGMFHKLTLLKDGYTKASCSYTNWGDWISIDWIESFGENKGYATQLLQYIKKQNPNVKEIGGEFVSKRIANLMKKVFGEPLKGNDPEADSYDDYLDDNDKSSCMTFKLNESVYFNDEVFNDWNDTYEQLKVLLNPSIEWLRNELNKPDCWGFRFLHNTEDNLLYVWDCHQSFMHQQVFDIIDPKWGKSGTNVIGIFEPEGVSVWEEMADDGVASHSIKLAKKLDGKLFKELYPDGYEIGLCN